MSDASEGDGAGLQTVVPQVGAGQLVERLDMIRDAQARAMIVDVDYGKVPGTDKPALLKPGAEKLSVMFQLDVQIANVKHWSGDHLTVESHAIVYHSPTGARLAGGEGICTTRERKYAWRKQHRVCPKCGADAVIKGKEEYGGGWLCWKKRDGCGAKFEEGADVIESQPVGEIENPDLPDTWNTIVKMAQKRARVDAILAATGASALFSQDVEDAGGRSAAEPPGPAGPPYGPEASDELATTAERALAYLSDVGQGPDDAMAAVILNKVYADTEAAGAEPYLPHVVARAYVWAASIVKERVDVTTAKAAEAQPDVEAPAVEEVTPTEVADPPLEAPGYDEEIEF